jgi:hypothetical protein
MGWATPTLLGLLERANLNHSMTKAKVHILGPYLSYKYILEGSDDGIQHLGLLDFWLSLSSRCLPHPHLRTETEPVSGMLCSLEYWMVDKVQKPSNQKCYSPSSEPFRIYKWDSKTQPDNMPAFETPTSNRHFKTFSAVGNACLEATY